MGTFGWDLPLEFGGAPSSGEKIYNTFRSMLGTGGVAISEDGIDGLELRAEAQALAACAAFDERAAFQCYPNLAIDTIEVFEEILGIVPGASATEQDRRDEISEEWIARNSSEIPTLQVLLQKIDPRLKVLDGDWTNSKVTITGMPFYPYLHEGWMNPPPYSQLPAYSSRSEFFVLLDIGIPGFVPGLPELAIIERVKRLLKIVLPAEDLPYITTEVGLIAGVSPVGFAGVTGA